MSLSNAPVKIMVAGLCLAYVRFAEGAIVSWDGGGDGTSWSDGLNWDGDAVPLTTDEVFINLDGTYTVTMDVDVTAASLTLGAAMGTQGLSLDGRILTLDGLGSINANGALTLKGGTIAGSGTLVNNGSMTSYVPGGNFINVGLENHGTLQLNTINNQTSQLTVADGFENDGEITLNTSNNNGSTTLLVTSGMITNLPNGIIRSGGGTRPKFVNAVVLNQGEIQAATSRLTLVNTGRIFDSTAGTLNIDNEVEVVDGETRLGSGTILLGTGTIRLSDTHTLVLDSPFTQPAVGVGPQLTFPDLVTVQELAPGTASFTLEGSLTLDDGDTFEAPLDNYGTLTSYVPGGGVINGAFANHGTLQLNTINNQTSQLTVADGFENDGEITLNTSNNNGSTTLLVTSGMITNLPNGIIRSGGGTRPKFVNAVVLNQGEIQAATSRLTLLNTGRIFDSTAGTLNIDNEIEVVGGETRLGSGTTLLGTGTLRLSDTHTLVLDSPFTQPAVGVGPQLTFPDLVTVQELAPGTASFTLEGSLTLDDGDTFEAPLVNNGTLTSFVPGGGVINGAFANHGTLQLNTINNQTSQLTVADGFENDGEIILNANCCSTTILLISSGVLMNLPNGSIRSGLSDGPKFIKSVLHNHGTIECLSSLTLQKESASHLNGVDGAVLITGGHLIFDQSGSGASVTNQGSMSLSASRQLQVLGGTFVLDGDGVAGGLVTGEGTFSLQGAVLSGSGAVSSVFTGNAASHISASGGETLALGHSGSTNGFVTSGMIEVGDGIVVLHDADTPSATGGITLDGGTLSCAGGITLTTTLSGVGTIEVGPPPAKVLNNGVINPGLPLGAIAVSGDYEQGGTGILNIELGGLVSGTDHDALNVSGTLGVATLGGTLNINLAGGYLPTAGDAFTVLTANARVGTFSSINGLSIPCDQSLIPDYNATDLTLDAIGGCEDDDACTANVCDGTDCSYPLNYDPVVACCNSETGDIATIDDGSVCTQDVCNPDGSVDHIDLTPEGFCCNAETGQLTFIDDENGCTEDICNFDGTVDHVDNTPPDQCCNPANGDLTSTDDSLDCTDDVCNPDGSVEHNDTCEPGLACYPQINECFTPVIASIHGTGLRELTINLAGGAMQAYALRITGDPGNPDVLCVSGYIQLDGLLGPDPVAMTIADWGSEFTLEDEAIIPGSTYLLDVEGFLPPETEMATTWPWGDVDGNLNVNFEDILNVVLGFQLMPVLPEDDLDLEPCGGNGIVNFADVLIDVFAFQGQTYVASGCEVPCGDG